MLLIYKMLDSDNIESLMNLLTFCKKEYCEENVHFLLDCEAIKSLKNDTEIENMSRKMYKKYFNVESNYELNIPQTMKKQVDQYFEKNSAHPGYRIFEDVRKTVVHMVDADVMPRFLKEIKASKNTA